MTPSIEYLAGLFDGEGHIGISISGGKGRPQLHYLVCSLGMTCEAAVRFFHVRFGGCVITGEKTSTGKTLFRWKTSNRNAARFAAEMAPYLIVKKAQALLALEFCQTRVRSQPLPVEEILRREDYRQRMAVLNGSTQAHRAFVRLNEVRTRRVA